MTYEVVSRIVIAAAVVAAQASPPEHVRVFLKDRIGFSAKDIVSIDAGRPVAVTLPTSRSDEVIGFGAVRVAASPEAFLQRLRDIAVFQKGAGVRQSGQFRTPPRLDDLSAMGLDPGDVDSLRDCRVGDCEVQLPGWAMATFLRDVPWKTPAAHDKANQVARQVVFDILSAYRSGGLGALSPYDDRRPPLVPSTELADILTSIKFLPTPLTEVRRYLTEYPHAPLARQEELFFWTRVAFSLKPTTRLNHLTIYPVVDPKDRSQAGLRYVMTTVQVYATHYFTAALEWHFVVDDPERPGAGFYLYYVSQSRTPIIGGWRGPFMRPVARDQGRKAIVKYLTFAKAQAER